jgi:predicted nicotinamide N-methyase
VCLAVWDSSIVVAKYLEKYLEKLGQSALRGKRCLDLSAGCGLVGKAASHWSAGSTLQGILWARRGRHVAPAMTKGEFAQSRLGCEMGAG